MDRNLDATVVFAVVAVAVAVAVIVDVAAVDEGVEDKNDDCCKVDDDDEEVGCDLRVKLCDEVQFDGMLQTWYVSR